MDYIALTTNDQISLLSQRAKQLEQEHFELQMGLEEAAALGQDDGMAEREAAMERVQRLIEHTYARMQKYNDKSPEE